MNYKKYHEVLISLKADMQRDGILKDSYIAVFNALITTVKKAHEDNPMPVLKRLQTAKKEAV